MAPLLPTTAAPGAATTTAVVRDGEKLVPREPKVPPRSLRAHPHHHHDSRRLRGCERERVFVGFSPRPKQDEALMSPEISWCEYHCAGFWTIVYGDRQRGEGQPMYFGFSETADAKAFEEWRRQRRDSATLSEDLE